MTLAGMSHLCTRSAPTRRRVLQGFHRADPDTLDSRGFFEPIATEKRCMHVTLICAQLVSLQCYADAYTGEYGKEAGRQGQGQAISLCEFIVRHAGIRNYCIGRYFPVHLARPRLVLLGFALAILRATFGRQLSVQQYAC